MNTPSDRQRLGVVETTRDPRPGITGPGSSSVDVHGIYAGRDANTVRRDQYAAGRDLVIYETGQQPVPPSPLQVRYSLPGDLASFTGRAEQVDAITESIYPFVDGDGVCADHTAVQVIDGMPGVGKTALAVKVAHQVKNQFPDRQLFIDLHAHTPGRDPTSPFDALAGLLTAVGVDPHSLPDSLDGRTALWRDRMAGQRALLVPKPFS